MSLKLSVRDIEKMVLEGNKNNVKKRIKAKKDKHIDEIGKSKEREIRRSC